MSSNVSYLADEGTPYEHVAVTDGETSVRIRNKLTNTIKEGWRVAETTVEIHAPNAAKAQEFNWRDVERTAYAAACEEAYRRNQIEGVA